MRYLTEVTIDLPRERVIELFQDRERYSEWQPGLRGYEPIAGKPGETGSTARFLFAQGRRTMDMIETLVSNELPDKYEVLYQTRGITNREVNRFIEEGSEQTRWVDESDFRFTGGMALLAPLIGGSFRKETRHMMELFRTYAESQQIREPMGARQPPER